MAYTAYRTWTTGEIVTAALMNEQVRDNGLLTAPAIMTTAGDIMYASAANTPARLAKDTNSTRVLTNTGTNNVPAWAQVTLTSGVTGTLPVGNGGTGITSLGSNVAAFLGTPSSANLRSALTDETGSGGAVFATSPTLVTPALGTPASGVLTNATGLPTAGIVDNAVTLAKMAGITRGSIIYGNASGDPAALTKGTEDYVLTAGADDISWAAAGGALSSHVEGGTRLASAGGGTVSYVGADFAPTAAIIFAVASAGGEGTSWGFVDDADDERSLARVVQTSAAYRAGAGIAIYISDASGTNSMNAAGTFTSTGIDLVWSKAGSGYDVNFIILYLR